MEKVLEQLRSIWGNLSPARRWTAIGTLVAVAAAFTWVIASNTGEQWQPLARGSNPEALKASVDALREQKIPVRLTDDGTVEVPKAHLDAARLEIATQSASGNLVGMEIFNEPKFGTTQFQDQVNYIRALEGELSRTVTSVEGVERARVHLVIPQKQLFVRDQKEPTASIKLTLSPGAQLSRKQTAGLQWLVSSAIEGMAPTNVTVVDQTGQLLAGPGADSMDTGETAYNLKKQYEDMKKRRVLNLLEPVVGVGKVRVDVTATMDFSHVKETVTDVDPEKQVLRTETTLESSSQGAVKKVGGVVGAQGNDPQRQAANEPGAEQSSSAKKQATRAWDTATTIRTRQLGGARVTQLNIGVVLDGTWADGGDGEKAWSPRTEEELAQLTDLVKSGAGIRTERGDQIKVVSVKFQDVAIAEPPPEPALLSPMMMQLIQYGVILLAVLMLVFGVIRPILKANRAKAAESTALARSSAGNAAVDEMLETVQDNVSIGELPEGSTDTDSAASLAPVGEALRLEAIEVTKNNPERAVAVIRAWLALEA